MSWRDAADMASDPSASSKERHLAEMLMEVFNKIQELEGGLSQLRKDLEAHAGTFHIQPVLPYDNEASLPISLVTLKTDCPECGKKDGLCHRKVGMMVTWDWKCVACGKTSDGTE